MTRRRVGLSGLLDTRDAASARLLERAVSALRMYQRNGMTSIAVEDVLALLGAAPGPPAAAVPAAPDPLADPVTGARWAGPPGTAPPTASR